MSIINAVDLFCGGGGTSTGLWHAAQAMGRKINLIAVNHWHIALNTHRENHPWARHLWADLDSLNPREVLKDMPDKKINVLVASPECIFHSNARGAKPIKEQLRASAWCVLRWAEAMQPAEILIENVPEFRNWGPLSETGNRIKYRAGETYSAYLGTIRSLGYTVEDRVINTADYGDPTTRQRLFIRARKGNRKINWPEPAYSEKENGLPAWRPAKEIIDWSLKGKSIFNRVKPLADATLKRIEIGLKKFGGSAAEPFLVMLYGTNNARSIHRPCPTITAGGNHIALCEPFLLGQQSGAAPRSVGKPVPTIATSGAISLIEPIITIMKGQSKVRGINCPLPTITTNPHLNLCEPFIVNYYGNSTATSINSPLPTITTKDRFGVVQAYQADVLFRMLQPHELAAAMSFPNDYIFMGTRAEIIKQIGNAVPVRTATALCKSLIGA